MARSAIASPLIACQDRTIDAGGHRLFTRTFGNVRSKAPPVLVLHGGPGVPHDYMEPLAALAGPDQAVVFYDQWGCGRSDRPQDPSQASLDAYAEEVVAVRKALGLDRVILLGHSWGGMLALEHALRDPAGIVGLVLSNTTASMPLHRQEVAKLVRALPPAERDVLLDAARVATPEAEAATMSFFHRHLCSPPWPEALTSAFAGLNAAIYGHLWGDEIRISGDLADWQRTADLGRIQTRTLVLGGELDYFTRPELESLAYGIPRARLEILPGVRHMAMYEAPEAYLGAVRRFLQGTPG